MNYETDTIQPTEPPTGGEYHTVVCEDCGQVRYQHEIVVRRVGEPEIGYEPAGLSTTGLCSTWVQVDRTQYRLVTSCVRCTPSYVHLSHLERYALPRTP